MPVITLYKYVSATEAKCLQSKYPPAQNGVQTDIFMAESMRYFPILIPIIPPIAPKTAASASDKKNFNPKSAPV